MAGPRKITIPDTITSLEELLASLVPSNDPKWVELSSEARRRGLSTTALRKWCLKAGVEIREQSHRCAFVSPGAIDAAIERLPVATGTPSRQRTPNDDADLDDMMSREGSRRHSGDPA